MTNVPQKQRSSSYVSEPRRQHKHSADGECPQKRGAKHKRLVSTNDFPQMFITRHSDSSLSSRGNQLFFKVLLYINSNGLSL